MLPNQTANGGNFPQTAKNNSESKTENRNQKDVIIRKQSSKSLLSPTAASNDVQPFRQKSQPPRNHAVGKLVTDSTATNEQQRRVTHSLGNQGSLNMSSGPTAIFYRDTHTLKDTLGNKTQMNLSAMLRSQNLLEEDGIEDLHFYFVSFHQHKRLILQHQRSKSQGAKRRVINDSSSPTVQNKTIESCDEELC